MSTKHETRKLQQIPPEQISPNPENPRLIFRQEEMDSLLWSIDKHGIQVPLSVYRDGRSYRLIDGERRWRCASKLNLKTVPALVQEKPSPLENLLLMYNIHALREQWDYFTIASKLTVIKKLYKEEHGEEPKEAQLSEATGLSRGQIRRCNLLLGLPERFQEMLHKELEKPKTRQRLSEDFFIEMERSLKTVTKRLPEYNERIDKVRDALVSKFKEEKISAVTDFRQLSKIATAVENLGVAHKSAQKTLDRVFDINDDYSIRDAYEATVEFIYDEQKASKQIESLNGFIEEIIEDDLLDDLEEDFVQLLKKLHRNLKTLLGR